MNISPFPEAFVQKIEHLYVINSIAMTANNLLRVKTIKINL